MPSPVLTHLIRERAGRERGRGREGEREREGERGREMQRERSGGGESTGLEGPNSGKQRLHLL